MSRNRSWVWTLNNYNEDDEKAIELWECKYTVYGREVGESGTKHLQGYTTFNSGKTLKNVKEMSARAHWEVAKTSTEAIAYCKKDGDFEEFGEKPKQGKRTDLDTAYELAKEGKSLKDAVEERLNYQALRVFQIARSVKDPVQMRAIQVEWRYGIPGSGKTYKPVAEGGHILSYENGFFSPYHGQTHVILDDIAPCSIPAKTLLRITDVYPFTLNIKGGHVQAEWNKVTITTTLSPEQFWAGYAYAGPVSQLRRRITDITLCTEVGTEVHVQKSGVILGPDTCVPTVEDYDGL